MLFSNNIYPYDNFQLRLARFRGNNKLEFIDNQRVEGNFFDLLDAGMSFFFKNLNLSGVITNKSLMREERLEVPIKALREVLINALCHRQWATAIVITVSSVKKLFKGHNSKSYSLISINS